MGHIMSQREHYLVLQFDLHAIILHQMIYVHVGGLGLLWVVLGCIIGEARGEKGG